MIKQSCWKLHWVCGSSALYLLCTNMDPSFWIWGLFAATFIFKKSHRPCETHTAEIEHWVGFRCIMSPRSLSLSSHGLWVYETKVLNCNLSCAGREAHEAETTEASVNSKSHVIKCPHSPKWLDVRSKICLGYFYDSGLCHDHISLCLIKDCFN